MKTKLRCAVYTRKSAEEGLDQAFNSLHAQREACEAYIKSQASEGWVAIREAYDDGGFSGGSMERPALARLLADIADGRVDVVVVYKVDRLTRSLTDFARIVEAFDATGVSFVSVTQAFNTTTSMGRLTLNVLLSFAQFEREVTGERIRDKIAASKAKGMWMGGNLPLGYGAPTDPVTRALVVNEAEAETIRLIFAKYLELASVHELKRWLDTEGIHPKRRRSRGESARFSRGALFHLLKNRTYVGEIPHRDRSYPGAHAAIVDRDTFEAAQQSLAEQARRRGKRQLRRTSALLAGRIFDASGDPMSPTFTKGAKGQVYRYYVSAPLQAGGRRQMADAIHRVPAAVIERLVRETVGATDLATLDAVERVEVHPSSVHVVVEPARLLGRPVDATDAAAEIQVALPAGRRVLVEGGDPACLRIISPVRLALRGGRIAIADRDGRPADTEQRADAVLIRALRTSHGLLAGLGGSEVGRPERAAMMSSPSNAYERNLIKLAFLSPDLQRQILEGRQPAGLTLQAIINADIPAAWADQKAWAEGLG